MSATSIARRAYEERAERWQADVDAIRRREFAPRFTPPTVAEVRASWAFEDVTLRDAGGRAEKLAMAVKSTSGTYLRFIVEVDAVTREWTCFPPVGYNHPCWTNTMICAVRERVLSNHAARLAN